MSERDARSTEAATTSSETAASTPGETSAFPAPVWNRHEPRVAGGTDVGVVRKVNQDAWGRFDDPPRGEILVVVADGLGGHLGGEVASQLAVDRIGEAFSATDGAAPDRLRAAIESANAAIRDASREDAALDGMGTTVVCLLLAEEGRSFVAHVGDSRLYRIRSGRIRPMTEDHSLVATLVREGVLSEDEALVDPRRNQILRALGVRDDVEIDIAPVELQPGDAYVLCSDGLHGMIDDPAIRTLAERPIAPDTIVERLIEAANGAGGADNVTAVVVQIPDPMTETTIKARASRLFESTRSIFTRRDGE